MKRRWSQFALAASCTLALLVAAAWVRQVGGGDDFTFDRYACPDAAHVEVFTRQLSLNGNRIILCFDWSRYEVNFLDPQSPESVREQYRPRTEFVHDRMPPGHPQLPWYPWLLHKPAHSPDTPHTS